MSGLYELSAQAKQKLDDCGLANQKMRVALILDVSGSMENIYGYYSGGQVAQLVKRLIALSECLDDDQTIEIFPFAGQCYTPISVNMAQFGDDASEVSIKNYFLDLYKVYEKAETQATSTGRHRGGTNYGDPLRASREYYFGSVMQPQDETPVLRIFVTDGGCTSPEEIVKQEAIDASCLPIFDKYIALTTSGETSFTLLSRDIDQGPILGDTNLVSNQKKRCLDNADFKAVSTPDLIDFEMLIDEVAEWLQTALKLLIVSDDKVKIDSQKFNAYVQKKRAMEQGQGQLVTSVPFQVGSQNFFVKHKVTLGLLATLVGAGVGFGLGYTGVVAFIGAAGAISGAATAGIGLAVAVGLILAITFGVWMIKCCTPPAVSDAQYVALDVGNVGMPLAVSPISGASPDYNRIAQESEMAWVKQEVQLRIQAHQAVVLSRATPSAPPLLNQDSVWPSYPTTGFAPIYPQPAYNSVSNNGYPPGYVSQPGMAWSSTSKMILR